MSEVNYGILKKGIEGREDLHENTLLWVAMGVYYGYMRYDIMEFYNRISNGIPAPSGTPLSGTGCITVSEEHTKEEVLAYIKDNRYCPRPFPETLKTQDDVDNAIMLLEMDPEFRNQVYSIVEVL